MLATPCYVFLRGPPVVLLDVAGAARSGNDRIVWMFLQILFQTSAVEILPFQGSLSFLRDISLPRLARHRPGSLEQARVARANIIEAGVQRRLSKDGS